MTMTKWSSACALAVMTSACVVTETELPDGTQCPANSFVTFKSGAWVCEPLAQGSRELPDGASCQSGSVATFRNGAWTCEAIPAGQRELPDGSTCRMGQVATFTNGAWTCATPAAAPLAGAGLTTDGDALAVDSTQVPLLDRARCADGMVVARSSTAADGWHCTRVPAARDGMNGDNGMNGMDGRDGAGAGAQSRPATLAECPTGGIVVQTWRDVPPLNGIRDGTEVLVDLLPAICNGASGTNGTPGAPGASVRSRVSPNAPTVAQCPTGGSLIEVWTDLNGNGTYDAGTEAPLTQVPACRGAAGPTGPAGASGVRRICGATNSLVPARTYTGAIPGGYSGAMTECSQVCGAGATMCTAADVTRHLVDAMPLPAPLGNGVSPSCNAGGTFYWSAIGAMSVTSDVRDCNSFTTNSGSVSGGGFTCGGAVPVLQPSTANCGQPWPILCCR